MQLSSRILSLSPSPTVALNAKAKALAQEGKKVLNFAVGEPDFPTPRPIVDVAIRALEQGQTKYGPAGGGAPLRQTISEKLARDNGLRIPADNIVCGAGAKEVLFHLFLATLNEGDEVLVPAPYWVSYTEQIKAAGAVPVVIPMPEPFSEGPIRPADLERHATDRTVGVVLTSPNNPAGYVLTRGQLEALGQVIRERGWWTVSDEIYESMSFDEPHVSLLKLFPELEDRFFLVNGMSKGYAMTGWRVGYVAGPAAAMKLVRSLQSHSSTCLPPFVEAAAAFALKEGPALLQKEIALLRGRRDLAVECLDRISGIGYIPPQGAFYAFVDMREALGSSKEFGGDGTGDTLGFCEKLLLEHQVAVVPGEAFGAKGFLRLSYATAEEDLREGIARIGKAVQNLSY